MTEEQFHGIIAYPVTPFKTNGASVDIALLAGIIEHVIASLNKELKSC